MMQVQTIVATHNSNTTGWRNWDDWRQFFDDGMTPDEAYREAHRQS